MSVLTPKVVADICEHVQQGKTFSVGARLAGVATSTFSRWLHLGRTAEEGPYYELVMALERARAIWEGKLSEVLTLAVLGQDKDADVKGILEVLRRRSPEDWGVRENLAVTFDSTEQARSEADALMAAVQASQPRETTGE